jgi:hypothetical protein
MLKDPQKIGLEAENAFRQLLNKHNIPYYGIDQQKDTFSYSLIKTFGVKRPDFTILIPQVGSLYVDVKGRRTFKGCFDISIEEIEKYKKLEILFNFNAEIKVK